MYKVALVALAVPVNQLYSYKISNEENLIGFRVLVQFGTRTMTGVIVGYTDNIEHRDLKEIIEVLDETTFYTPKMLQFTKFVAEYYLSSWGETLKLASPPGASPESDTYINVKDDCSSDNIRELKKVAPRSYELYTLLKEYKTKRISIKSVKKDFKQQSIYFLLENLERRGLIDLEENITNYGKVKKVKSLIIDPLLITKKNFLSNTLNKLEVKHQAQARLLSYIFIHQQANEIVHQDAALYDTKCERKDLQSLKNKKIILTNYIEDLVGSENEAPTLSSVNELELPLSNEQIQILSQFKENITNNINTNFLLRGITGSGKTLIYMHLIDMVLKQGKSTLLLVPEIALTPQLSDRFKISFHNEVALVHSKMSDAERMLVWKQISLGKKKIVIGVRSAIFAPIQDLGLIIVDEEHDTSYKQESPNPRYNARDISLIRAKIENCPIVLGTATPSIETYYNSINGKLKLLELNSRVDNAELPKIVTIDMGEARKQNTVSGTLSHYLLELIEDRIHRKEGIIIFQNRRGYAPVLRCTNCAYIYECPNCSIKLTYHKSRNILRCHFCAHIEKYPDRCKECGETVFENVGYGTQRIEDELKSYLLDKGIKAYIDRLDYDAVSKKDSQRKILERFYNGKTDILVGTQMVTKGLNFDRVSLVGVVNADTQLYMPDFRANEKAFQILTQVAGRAGRKKNMDSIVLIQTYSPNNYAIKAVRDNYFEEFYKYELDIRQHTHYPPYSRVTILEFYGEEEEKVQNYASNFRKYLPDNSDTNILEIFGPFIPTTFKQARNFRRMIMIKSSKTLDKSGAKLRTMIKQALSNFPLTISPTSVMLKVDIDSYSQM
ncbi:MAG TPA: primosomal protein N' [Candidatus Kapabacteria bacterium]|nr:primosomal protein N' [Candidatus Kapabacteria bacterium]